MKVFLDDKMEPSFSDIVSLPFEELEAICFDPSSQLQNTLDCHWDLWRRRAETLYGISPAFFDLPRTFRIQRDISGLQRYIELSNSIKLNPQGGVKVYENGLIEGVYEAPTGLLEALRRDDPQGVEYFLNRIQPEALEYLSKKDLLSGENFGPRAVEVLKERTGIKPLDVGVDVEMVVVAVNQRDLQDLNDPEKAREIFSTILRSGDPQYFDLVVPHVMTVPQDFTLQSYIPKLPFQVLDPAWVDQGEVDPFPLSRIPGAQPEKLLTEIEDLFKDALYGANVQMVDFLRSYFSIRTLGDVTINGSFSVISSESLFQGYQLHRRIEDVYSLLQRFDTGAHNPYDTPISSDILLYTSLQPSYTDYSLIDLFYNSMGDIPLTLTLVDILFRVFPGEKKKIKQRFHIILDIPFQPNGEKIVIREGARPIHLRDEPDISIYPLTEAIYRQIEKEL